MPSSSKRAEEESLLRTEEGGLSSFFGSGASPKKASVRETSAATSRAELLRMQEEMDNADSRSSGLGSFMCGSGKSPKKKTVLEAMAETARLEEELIRMRQLMEEVKCEEDEREKKDNSYSMCCWNGCSICGLLCLLPGLVFLWVAYVAIYCLVTGYFEGTGCVINHTQGLAEKYGPKFTIKEFGKDKSGNMTASPNYGLWHDMKNEHLENTFVGHTGSKYGYASAEVAPELIFKGTKVDGVFEHVPKKLRGVFWMDGNPLPEILATFQYGRWYDKEQILITPKVPWGWGFWGADRGTMPKWEQNCGSVLTSVCVATPGEYDVNGKDIAQAYTAGWEELWVVKVESDPEDGKFFARLQMNANGDLSKRWVDVPPTGVPQAYTLEEEDDGEGPAGTRFFRGVYFGCGMVPPWRYGYTAKKIIDEHGEKVQPYFDQYLDFMNKQKIIVMWEADGW